MLVTKIKIELDQEEYKNFSRYQQNHDYPSLQEAVKAAALRSLPKRKRWGNESMDAQTSNRNL